ncbi:uncharacterized protein [Triticum aestivum]|uniref:uncharacterized protein n=1 Tax=Triticum aestivum TaxID=4565 RepID=UPI001D005626|nr:uncharacterized protein LOC123142625 [Triticum aestivum]
MVRRRRGRGEGRGCGSGPFRGVHNGPVFSLFAISGTSHRALYRDVVIRITIRIVLLDATRKNEPTPNPSLPTSHDQPARSPSPAAVGRRANSPHTVNPTAAGRPPIVVRPFNPRHRGSPIYRASPGQPRHHALPNHRAARRHPHRRAPPAIPASMTPPLSSRSAAANFGGHPVEQLGSRASASNCRCRGDERDEDVAKELQLDLLGCRRRSGAPRAQVWPDSSRPPSCVQRPPALELLQQWTRAGKVLLLSRLLAEVEI